MFGIGMQELIFIFLIVFLLFGAKALPEIARSLGTAFYAFKRELNGFKEEINSDSSKLVDQNKNEKDKANDSGAAV